MVRSITTESLGRQDVGDGLVVGVHEHLGQGAVAGLGNVVLVVAGDLLIQVALRAVHIALELVVVESGLADGVVQLLAGDGGGVLGNHQILLSIGADLVAAEAPGAGRTAEHIGGVVVQLQVAHVQLLAQLHDGAADQIAVVVGGPVIVDGPGVGLVAGFMVFSGTEKSRGSE